MELASEQQKYLHRPHVNFKSYVLNINICLSLYTKSIRISIKEYKQRKKRHFTSHVYVSVHDVPVVNSTEGF